MDDATAIEKCAEGDWTAFRHLVESYQKQAVGHAVAILGNREDALDAAQEAFTDAFRALKNFDKTRRFYPWFYVLLRRRCYKMAAQRRATVDLTETEIFAAAPNVPVEERLMLEKALMTLTAENRELIALKYLDGLSYEEISERLEIPRGTVMSRLFYIRRQLQTKLSGKINREELKR